MKITKININKRRNLYKIFIYHTNHKLYGVYDNGDWFKYYYDRNFIVIYYDELGFLEDEK